MEKKNVRQVLVVDDHPIVRHGLSQLIGQEDDLAVCGEASSANEAMSALTELKPDVAIVDIILENSNGIELIKRIRAAGFDLPLLVLSMHEESVYAERALRAGANGYVMKQQADETVIEALNKILAGEMYVSDKISARMLRQYIGGPKEESGSSAIERLTDRELEVFEWMGRGLSTQKIAEKLGLSAKTVEVHRANIKKKLKVEDITQLMREAVRWVGE